MLNFLFSSYLGYLEHFLHLWYQSHSSSVDRALDNIWRKWVQVPHQAIFILHEVKRASEASEASRSEMVEISRSLQLCMSFPPHIGKKNFFLPPSGTGVIRKCLCVRVSVRLSQRKSAVTFEPGDGYARNFQGCPHSSQVIFGRVTRTPEYSGPGPDPEKWVLREIYLLLGFWAGGDVFYHFGN